MSLETDNFRNQIKELELKVQESVFLREDIKEKDALVRQLKDELDIMNIRLKK
jgi:hypothetical protein